jgi:hypothetical protein
MSFLKVDFYEGTLIHAKEKNNKNKTKNTKNIFRIIVY